MTIVKTLAYLAAFFCSATLLSGCGAGDDPKIVTTSRYTPVTLALKWSALPAGTVIPTSTTTRATTVPAATFSVKVRLTNLSVSSATENDLVTVATIDRSTTNRAAYQQTYVTPTQVARTSRDTYVEVQCFSGLKGEGTLIASQKVLLKPLPANGNLGDFTLASPAP